MVKDIKILIESFFDDMFDEHDEEISNSKLVPDTNIEDQTHELMVKTLEDKPDCGKVNEIIDYVEKNIDPVYSIGLIIILDSMYDQILFYNQYLNLISYNHFSYKENIKKVDLMIDYFYRIYDIKEQGRDIYPQRHGNKVEITYKIKPKTVNESFFDDMFDEHDEESNNDSILSGIDTKEELSSYFSKDGLKSIERKYIDNTNYPDIIDNEDFLLYEKYIKVCEEFIELLMPLRGSSYEIKLQDNICKDQYDDLIITLQGKYREDPGHILIKGNDVYMILPKLLGQAFFSSAGNSYQISNIIKMQNVLCKYDLPCTHIIMDGNYKNLNLGNNFDTVDDNVFNYVPKLCYFEYENLNVRLDLSEQIKFDLKISNVYLHVPNDISSDMYIKVLDYTKKMSNAKTIDCYTNSDELNNTYLEWSINHKNVLYKFNSENNRDKCVRHIVTTLRPLYVKNSSLNFMYSATWHDKGKDKKYGSYNKITINLEYDDIDHDNKHRWIDIYVDFYQTGKLVVNKVKDSFNEYNK